MQEAPAVLKAQRPRPSRCFLFPSWASVSRMGRESDERNWEQIRSDEEQTPSPPPPTTCLAPRVPMQDNTNLSSPSLESASEGAGVGAAGGMLLASTHNCLLFAIHIHHNRGPDPGARSPGMKVGPVASPCPASGPLTFPKKEDPPLHSPARTVDLPLLAGHIEEGTLRRWPL